MNQRPANLDRIILSFPSLLSLATTVVGSHGRCWIQLARTGSFQSSRYGKFSITREDLAQMAHNFNEVTPRPPTQLPIDFDHLSMDPKHPGDGKAAGWLQKVALRANGDELWGEVEWTPEAADLIRSRAYRFVSPSFVKDHTHKDGRKIGTTLLAAAVTNHPFLEGMQAITLYNFATMGDLGLNVPTTVANQGPPPTVRQLAERGQHVTFLPDAERTPELTDKERAQTFIVKSTAGVGDDQFVRLTLLDGRELGWFRVTQLEPAPARLQHSTTPLPTRQPDANTEDLMLTTTDFEKKAAAFAERITALSDGRTVREAITLAMAHDAEGAAAYRLATLGVEWDTDPHPDSELSLSAQPGEPFDAVAARYAVEKNVPLRDAVRAVGRARPDLAQVR